MLCGYKPVQAMAVTPVLFGLRTNVDYGCRSRTNRRIIRSILTVIYK